MPKNKKERRSSILKPTKPRKPLSDVSASPPPAPPEPKRRVSFASSNLINLDFESGDKNFDLSSIDCTKRLDDLSAILVNDDTLINNVSQFEFDIPLANPIMDEPKNILPYTPWSQLKFFKIKPVVTKDSKLSLPSADVFQQIQQDITNLKNMKVGFNIREILNIEIPEEKLQKKKDEMKKELNFDDIPISTINKKLQKNKESKNIEKEPIRVEEHGKGAADVAEIKSFVERMESKNNSFFSITSLSENKMVFRFFHKDLEFIVDIEPSTEMVKSLKITKKVITGTTPRFLYVLNLFEKKISEEHIQSSLGRTYNVMSLLDFLCLLRYQMWEVEEELKKLEVRRGLKIQPDMTASIQFLSSHLLWLFHVHFNMQELDENIFKKLSVDIKYGNIPESNIKIHAKGKSISYKFLKEYIDSVRNYIKIKENEKNNENRYNLKRNDIFML